MCVIFVVQTSSHIKSFYLYAVAADASRNSVVMGMSVAMSNSEPEPEPNFMLKAMAGDANEPYKDNMNYTNEDDGYGVTWMYIPDGNGVPQVAYLTGDPETSRGRRKNVKDHVRFELYTM